MKTHILPIIDRGKQKFVLDIRHPGGKRQRHIHPTRKSAEIEQESLKTQIAISGEVWTSLNAREQSEVLFAVHEAQNMGASVREVVEFYKAHRSKNHRAVPLLQVVNETIQAARNKQCRPRYVDALHKFLNRFARGREQMPITRVGLSEVENWLGAQTGRDGKAAPATIMGLRSKLCALFAEAVRQRYIEEFDNPMRRVICPKLNHGTPAFFRPKEAHDLLLVCRQTDKEFLAWLTLGLFAGVRPEELERMTWDQIDFARGEVKISDEVSKVRRRRIVVMKDCGPLKEWLEEAWVSMLSEDHKDFPYIVPVDGDRNDPKVMQQIRQMVKRHRARLCERAGITWKSDVLRKSACTYLVDLHQSADKVALILGNSPQVIHEHYRSLAQQHEIAEFWNLTPANVKNDLITLPPGGYGKTKTGKLI